jgi:23S rRNA (cytidine2498-2'-O)-methyltransferase
LPDNASVLGLADVGSSLAYLAPEGYEAALGEEMARAGVEGLHWLGRLLLAPGPIRQPAWCSNIWQNPRLLRVSSAADAARQLRSLQRGWASYAFDLHRRTALIQAQLPHVSARPLRFPQPAPAAPLGSWTLIDRNTLLASPDCSSPFPNGEVGFVEDHEAPPSRAYLKLWEALTRIGRWPGVGQTCVDLGASPGGWTWALQQLGATVIAVDKAPLDAAVEDLPGVSVIRESAFALGPGDFGPVDWLLSDVVCYPKRLLGLMRRWVEAGSAANIICTVKFQGATDHDVASEFAAIPGSRLVHLHHNKHELTWIWAGGHATLPLRHA